MVAVAAWRATKDSMRRTGQNGPDGSWEVIMSVEQRVPSATAFERAATARSLLEATSILRERGAALRRAGEWMKLGPEQGDIVEVADAAMAYQAALERVHVFEDRLRHL